MKKQIRKILTFYAAHIMYRKHAYNECCCCGQDMETHSMWDNHTPRCMKEYAVASWVDEVMKKL